MCGFGFFLLVCFLFSPELFSGGLLSWEWARNSTDSGVI